MAKADTLIIGGHGYSWQQLRDLRRQQLEARRAAQPQQLTLFELRDDHRPEAERTVAGRYEQPTLLGWMRKN
jgi:hypothetical protein